MEHDDNPYVGPRAFRDGERLYGRDRERRDLLNLLIAERIVLIYSPSGAGKTSLIQAALVPDLQEEEFFVLPIVRVGAVPPSGSAANRYIFSTLASLEKGLADADRASAPAPGEGSLGEMVAAFSREEGQRTLLIFDQFEEVFTADAADSGERREFFVQLAEALKDPNLWVLIAMREDYIANLDPYSGLLPTRLANRFRLDLLGPEAAAVAIKQPAAAEGAIFHPDAADRLVDNLRQVGAESGEAPRLGPHIEPVHLQIACLELWERMEAVWQERGAREISVDDIQVAHDVDQALGRYYDVKLAGIAAGEPDVQRALFLERKIREWFERRLITPEGVRAQVLKGSSESKELGQPVIDALLEAYLVRTDDRRNATWFELAHDRLVQPVRTRNAEWLRQHFSPFRSQAVLWRDRERDPDLLFAGQSLDEAEAWAERHPGLIGPVEAEFLHACQEARRNRHREKRRRLAVVLLTLVAGISIITTLFFFYQNAEGRVATELKNRQQAIAQKQRTDELVRQYERTSGTLREFRARAAREQRAFLEARRAAEGNLSRLRTAQDALRGEIARLGAESARVNERYRVMSEKIQQLRRDHPEFEGIFAAAFPDMPRLPSTRERERALEVQQERERSGTLARANSNNRWGLNLWATGSVLRIKFLDGSPALRRRVMAVVQEWTRYANLRLEESEAPDAEIRITFEGDGSWSYMGTEALGIAAGRPTMTLGWEDSPGVGEGEFRRAVLHEFGHALGLIHEHQNPNAAIPWDRDAVYAYFGQRGWTNAYTDINVLTRSALPNYRPFDPHSIMLLGNFPRDLFTRDFVLEQGNDLSQSDRQFIAELYPGR